MKKSGQNLKSGYKPDVFYMTTLRLIEKGCAIFRRKRSVSPKHFHSHGTLNIDLVQIIVDYRTWILHSGA